MSLVEKIGHHFVAFIPWVPMKLFEKLVGEIPETWECTRSISSIWLIVRAPTLADIIHARMCLDDLSMDGIFEVAIEKDRRRIVRMISASKDGVPERNRELVARRGYPLE